MRKILLFVLLSICTGISAQNIIDKNTPYDFFCEVQLSGDNEGIVYMPFQKGQMILCDSLDNKIKFNSIGEILVYMSKRGWEYIESRHEKAFSMDIIIPLLKKKVTQDSQSLDFLSLQQKIYGKKKKKED